MLGIEQVGINDNFFELGGHSLLATRLIAQLRTQFGVELQLRSFFERPTVTGLAAAITELRSGAKDEQEVLELLAQLTEDETALEIERRANAAE